MKKKIRIDEHEYRDRLQSLLNSVFNAQVQPLRSMQTVTKKRRALKRKVADNAGLTKSSATPST
jgi:hypothetical protein